jgi:hypothetical protein
MMMIILVRDTLFERAISLFALEFLYPIPRDDDDDDEMTDDRRCTSIVTLVAVVLVATAAPFHWR